MNIAVRHTLLYVLAVCTFYTAGSALADSWGTLMSGACRAEKAHKLDESQKLYEAALKQAEAFGEGDPRLLLSIKGLADLYIERGVRDKSEKLYLRYLKMVEHLDYVTHPMDQLKTILMLGLISREEGRMSDSIRYCRKALPLAKEYLGENSEQVANINAQIGICCYFAKRYGEGIAAVKETLRIHQINQPNSLQVANDLAQLAGLYGDTHNFAQADALGRQAMTIRLKLCKPGDVLIVRSIEGLAINKGNQHKNDEAIEIFNSGYHMAERAFGKDPCSMSIYMIELASAYRGKGDYSKAIPLYEKALAIQKKVLSRKDSTIARSVSELADCYLKSGNPTSARRVCEDYLKFVSNAKVSDEALSKVKKILDKCP